MCKLRQVLLFIFAQRNQRPYGRYLVVLYGLDVKLMHPNYTAKQATKQTVHISIIFISPMLLSAEFCKHILLYLQFYCESLNEPLHLRCGSYLHEQIVLSRIHIRAI